MSLENLKIEMLLDSIIDTCSKTTSGNVTHQIATIKHHAQIAKEKLKEMDVESDVEITEQALQDLGYNGVTTYDKNSPTDTKNTVQITDYKIPISTATVIECTFGEFYEGKKWNKNPVNVELFTGDEYYTLHFTKMSQIDQLKQLLSIKKGE